MALEHLGQPLTATFAIAEGTARLYEHGAVIHGSAGEVLLTFKLPMVGMPHIAAGAAGMAALLYPAAFSFVPGAWDLALLASAFRHAFDGRVGLMPTGGPAAPVSLTFGAPQIVVAGDSPDTTTYGIPCTARLRERQLYDVAVRKDDGQWTSVAPNAIYYRSTWHDFGVAHITDLHLGRRIDYFPGALQGLGQPEAAERLYNWNDRFRGFIRYANYLHGIGVLDVILATGDIIDYMFEDDDDPDGGGNALFAREIILGRWPNAGFEDVGPLRVPIFVVGGNHDYRRNRYRLVFNLDAGLNVHQFQNYPPYNIPWRPAIALSRGDTGDEVPELDADATAKMVAIDSLNVPFAQHLNNRRSYVVALGAHRIVMLDSTWDVGVASNAWDAIKAWLGWIGEDERTFIGGSPNSEGVSSTELQMASEVLQTTPNDALVIVGLHAPLFNPWMESYPYFLRETQRPALGHLVAPHLARFTADVPPGASEDFVQQHVRRLHPSWFGTGGSSEPAYVKRGDHSDLFDYGVSRGRANELLRLIAGLDGPRPADVTLHGHVHRFNEFRLAAVNGELAYFMDFYTQNPGSYYPVRFPQNWPGSDVAFVDVVDSAPLKSVPTEVLGDAKHKFVVQVPPCPTPLATSADPRGWWTEHRPLVLQTEALGPLKDRTVSFGGFRLLSVKADVIDKIHFVPIQPLHERGYRWDWQEVIRPPSPPRYQHLQRSRQYEYPEGVGVPCGYLGPTALQNIVYRDARGRMLELWRDDNGGTGAGNLTSAAHDAPGASGDPFVYVETSTGTQVVLYRGRDGHINSVYWATGDVGYDHLSSSVGAPTAAGNPVGYYFGPADINHVVYRKPDGHLHVLWWQGQGRVGHADLTREAGALRALGDPSAMVDARGNHVVVYRATDGHIHTVFWSTGPSGHESLSGYARAPKATGDPHAYYTAHDDVKQIVYRGVDGHIHELWWAGDAPVAHRDLSAIAGAPLAGSDPVSFSSSQTNTRHVIYRSSDDRLIELWWFPGGGTPAFVDLSALSRAPRAVGKPGAFANGPWRHVVYRGSDNQVHEIRWW